jgi:hypothetical protein
MKRKIKLTILKLLFTVSAFAQFDSIVNEMQQKFDQFRHDIEQEHRQFRNKNDSVFAKFLKDSWEEFEVFYNEKKEPPKPVVQPEVKDQEHVPQEITPSPSDSAKAINLPQGRLEKPPGKEPEPRPAEPTENFGRAMMDFDFYGTSTSTVLPGKLPDLEQIDEENIKLYFTETANLGSVLDLVRELKETQKKMRLNDWGYYKLVEQTSKMMESSTYRQALFSWVVLLKSGYNVKAGYTKNDIFIMLPAQEEIFSSYYLTVDGTPYYIQTDRGKNEPLPRLKVHRANYPENSAFSLRIYELPLTGNNPVKKELYYNEDTLRFNTNKWLTDFYNDYPLCDMVVYFLAPLSHEVLKPLSTYLNKKFQGKTGREKVALLLNFVQNAFAYKTDGDQFGHEKYFFPDEVFYYPFSDCEDRSVLFARLVTHFTDYDCIGLDFPGHVNTAVAFDQETEGTYIEFEGKKYTICDPTYENAPVGYLDARYEKFQPGIITFDK